MFHEAGLIAIAVVGLAALLCGMVMTWLRQPAIVGYILAGVILGPSVLGLVAERDNISLLADIGVLLLLFLIGMELPLRSFMRVWKTALGCMALQIAGALGFNMLLSYALGWNPTAALVGGFIMALSSTAVAIKILEDIGEVDSETGRLTIAVLIAQDLAVVPMMLVVRNLSGEGGIGWIGMTQIAFAVLFLIGFLVVLAKSGTIRLPLIERLAGHNDLRALAALAVCLGAATISGLIGLSPAYGAFLAGVLIGNSRESEAMAEATRPIQSILMMVFFLSIGLLIDLGFIRDNIGAVLLWLLVVTLFKTVLNIGILRMLGTPWNRAFLAGTVMGQIGEFSFVIAGSAAANELVTPEGHRMAVAIIALSLVVSPLWMVMARRLDDAAAIGITSFREILRALFTPGETPSMAKVVVAAEEGLQRRREERDGNGSN
ncbi:MAG TPA: cation:proton antiporter [Alphaproteobacteria bacterium]|jgi:CPA2 family monovalent cation:H+ antiporter-2